jgi:hypothetical protein
LDRLLERESEVLFLPDRGELEGFGPGGYVRVPVTVLPPVFPEDGPPRDREPALEPWTGTDGRPARVIWFDDRKAIARN